ncbi:MAG: hypothetical protein DMF88_01930 [Acidobacteria bacterium]|nr:MAG: hypothetical protein DMF88_01930 [Acidobacteriota bacterium]
MKVWPLTTTSSRRSPGRSFSTVTKCSASGMLLKVWTPFSCFRRVTVVVTGSHSISLPAASMARMVMPSLLR